MISIGIDRLKTMVVYVIARIFVSWPTWGPPPRAQPLGETCRLKGARLAAVTSEGLAGGSGQPLFHAPVPRVGAHHRGATWEAR
jgi:hypothetical protein